MPAIIFLNSCQTRCWRSFSRFSVCRIMNYRSYFIETEDKTVCFSTFCNPFYSLPVYHAIYLEELTAAELTEKIAQLFNISPRQINQIFKQGPTGIHVLVSDEVRSRFFSFFSLHLQNHTDYSPCQRLLSFSQMIQNFQDEVCFVLDTMKGIRARR